MQPSGPFGAITKSVNCSLGWDSNSSYLMQRSKYAQEIPTNAKSSCVWIAQKSGNIQSDSQGSKDRAQSNIKCYTYIQSYSILCHIVQHCATGTMAHHATVCAKDCGTDCATHNTTEEDADRARWQLKVEHNLARRCPRDSHQREVSDGLIFTRRDTAYFSTLGQLWDNFGTTIE